MDTVDMVDVVADMVVTGPADVTDTGDIKNGWYG